MTTNPDPPLLREVARLFAQRVGQHCLFAALAGVLGVAALTAVSMYILGGISLSGPGNALAFHGEGKK